MHADRRVAPTAHSRLNPSLSSGRNSAYAASQTTMRADPAHWPPKRAVTSRALKTKINDTGADTLSTRLIILENNSPSRSRSCRYREYRALL